MNLKRTIPGIATVIGALLLCVGGILVIRLLSGSKNNPPVIKEPNWDSPQTRALMERACFDCHSNETRWPWYSYVPPVSWMIAREVQTGRAELNYSEWSPAEEDESIEAILEGEMPPENYLMLHPKARLTKTETKALISGLKATFGNRGGEEHEFDNEYDEHKEHQEKDKEHEEEDEHKEKDKHKEHQEKDDDDD